MPNTTENCEPIIRIYKREVTETYLKVIKEVIASITNGFPLTTQNLCNNREVALTNVNVFSSDIQIFQPQSNVKVMIT